MIRYLRARPTAFDSDVIQILSRALDDAWDIVLADKIGFRLDGNPDAVRDVLAKHCLANAFLIGIVGVFAAAACSLCFLRRARRFYLISCRAIPISPA